MRLAVYWGLPCSERFRFLLTFFHLVTPVPTALVSSLHLPVQRVGELLLGQSAHHPFHLASLVHGGLASLDDDHDLGGAEGRVSMHHVDNTRLDLLRVLLQL